MAGCLRCPAERNPFGLAGAFSGRDFTSPGSQTGGAGDRPEKSPDMVPTAASGSTGPDPPGCSQRIPGAPSTTAERYRCWRFACRKCSGPGDPGHCRGAPAPRHPPVVACGRRPKSPRTWPVLAKQLPGGQKSIEGALSKHYWPDDPLMPSHRHAFDPTDRSGAPMPLWENHSLCPSSIHGLPG